MAGKGNPDWKLGVGGNPNGRPVGARNKRTKEIIQQIIDAGHKDPLVTLSEISATHPDDNLRATAANMLAPYMHSKMQSAPAPRFLDQIEEIPKFTTVQEAEDYLAELTSSGWPRSLGLPIRPRPVHPHTKLDQCPE
jgi:hypothetical protein